MGNKCVCVCALASRNLVCCQWINIKKCIYLFIYLVATIRRRRTNGKKKETMSALKGPMDSMDARMIGPWKNRTREWPAVEAINFLASQYKRRMTIFVSPHTAPRTNKSVSPDPLLISSFVSSVLYINKNVWRQKNIIARGWMWMRGARSDPGLLADLNDDDGGGWWWWCYYCITLSCNPRGLFYISGFHIITTYSASSLAEQFFFPHLFFIPPSPIYLNPS